MKTSDYIILFFNIILFFYLLISVFSCAKEDEERCIDYLIEQEKGEEVCVNGICTIQFHTTITCSFNEEDIDEFSD